MLRVEAETEDRDGEWVCWVIDQTVTVCGASCCDMVGISRGVDGTKAEHAAG